LLRKKGRKPRELLKYQKLPIPLKWISGPDSVRASVRGRSMLTDGYFLNITHEDRGMEVDRIALINLKGNVAFFDGEVSHGQILNQVVGLFHVDRLEQHLAGRRFTPDRVFFDATKRNPRELGEIIKKEYLTSKALRRTQRDRTEYRRETDKFDLCPVTRNIIRRYLDWRDQQPETSKQAEDITKQVREAAKTEVFISFRTEAEPIARRLADFLRVRGHQPFFSADSLAEMGESDYCQAIDNALEAARCMVVIATRPEHFASGWVSYEWRSFLNEVHSKRKQGGKLFTFVSGIEAGQLPFALRSQQMVRFSESAPQDSVEDLYRYIRPALRHTRR
jgi:hypothetical protein